MATDLIQSKPVAAVVRATKTLVESLLAMNTRNRTIRPSVVAYYKRMIEDGRWLVVNQGIGVSASGILIDGQHRLEALKAAGYPAVDLVLVLGLKDEAAAAIDQGANRNARDYLHFLFNERVSALTTAILRTLMMLVKFEGRRDYSLKFDPREYADTMVDYADSLRVVFGVEGHGKLAAAILAACVDAVQKGYADEVQRFMADVISGEMLAKNSPALALKKWAETTRGAGGSSVMTERFNKTKAAIAHYIEGKPVIRLSAGKKPRNYELRT
jgi:hypothetical protein